MGGEQDGNSFAGIYRGPIECSQQFWPELLDQLYGRRILRLPIVRGDLDCGDEVKPSLVWVFVGPLQAGAVGAGSTHLCDLAGFIQGG